ncbi:hypothetical protein [Streptomyces sp. NBC_01363]|uniref:hypothetical protein n=1 Tax=Streptomyces sp. NBC_01363 TaxID=2903840 RepID=UPI00224D7EBF|nr:hypothetical protein [Streptomyces sp. NBC_01363]MCX4731497.1 lantibiotic dehydratase family protein [Streptomyces sp. NBC_01363]
MTTQPTVSVPLEDHSPVDPAAGALVPVVSSCTVHRINQLPVEALDLDLSLTSQQLERETALEQLLKERAGSLSDALHEAIPTLEEAPAIRRAALELRRAVHNHRPAKLSADVVQSLSESVDVTTGRMVAQWLDGMRELTALRMHTDEQYEAETARATERLRAVLADQRFEQGLSHANPHLLSHLTSKSLEPNSKAARSVIGYVSRAALKTSPFSRLTALALDGQHADGAGHSYADQQHVRSWVDTLARDERFAAAFQVEPNRSARYVSGRPHLLMPSYGGSGDAAWRTDTLVDASLYSRLWEELASWPRMTIAEALVRIGGQDPFGGFLRLLDTGWLCLVLPWTTGERDPLLALARTVEPVRHPAAQRTAELLRQLQSGAAGLHLLPGSERVRTVGRLISGIGSAPEGDPQPSVRFAVYEDAVSDIPLSLPAQRIQEDLVELGELIRPYIFRSHVYDWVQDEFVALYGRGAYCADAYEFLWAIAAAPGFEGKLFQALQLDHRDSGRPTDRAWLPVSASSAPPTAGTLYQVAAQSPEDIQLGRHQTIVNQYNSGVGGLIARFRKQLNSSKTPREGLTQQLQDWATELFPQADPHQVTLAGDVNGMHDAADGILPRLRWPSEPCRPDESPNSDVPFGIKHNPTTDTLEFVGREGRTIAPVYLGVVPQHLVPGVARLLLCLADPWVNGSRMCCTRSPIDVSPPPADKEIELIPRRTHRRLVLGRRTWRFDPAVLPRPGVGEAPAAYFRRMHEWRSSQGIPDEVFVSVESPSLLTKMTPSSGKPFWLSFRSPHAIWAALNQIGKANQATAIRLSEAHPHRSSFWVRDNLGRHHAAEHVSLMRWERPSGNPPCAEMGYAHAGDNR